MTETLTALEAERERLTAAANDLAAQIASEKANVRAAALDEAKQLVADHGFKPEDLFSASLLGLTKSVVKRITAQAKPAKASQAGKFPAAYRNPENPTQTWVGRGKRPQWLTAGIAAGKVLSDYKIAA
jgi:DNA-binding protein H-NS